MDLRLNELPELIIRGHKAVFNERRTFTDVLGNSVESAISATKQALYILDNPLEPTHKSIEVRQAYIKERDFYMAFISKLEQL